MRAEINRGHAKSQRDLLLKTVAARKAKKERNFKELSGCQSGVI
jgi:hypothetical protein